MVQAIILAAGKGTRIMPHTKNIPKTLIKLDDKAIVEHLITSLNKAGVVNITMVFGYQANKIKAFLGNKVKYVYNHEYETTNNLYSLVCAVPEINEEFIVLMGDSVLHPNILKELLKSKGDIITAVDNNKNLDEESFKAVIKGNLIKDLGREISLKNAHGEFLALTKFLESCLNINM